jgi:hypothetical protein
MNKPILFLALSLVAPLLHAFELPALNAARVAAAPRTFNIPVPVPAPYLGEKQASAKFYALHNVNGVQVAVPGVGNGYNLMIALPAGSQPAAYEAKLRQAFAAPAAARLTALQPQSRAELELAAAFPGHTLAGANQFLPAGAAAIFNREPNFGGPNCFNAAFVAAGMMPANGLRHVGNPETDQLLLMYYKKTSADSLKPGDIIVINNGDHGVFYLGGGLVFHKKSYLKQHIYRIVPLDKVYAADPGEWTPGPFDSGLYNGNDTVRSKQAWRPTGAKYPFGQASAEEQAKVETIIFLAENITRKAPNWAVAKDLGYFTEKTLESLVSDWAALGKSPNPVLRAYYRQLESLRDQSFQSIENEQLSSPHAQSNATEVLKRVWFPRNDFSRAFLSRLLAIYGRDASALDGVMNAVEKDFEGNVLRHVKSS